MFDLLVYQLLTRLDLILEAVQPANSPSFGVNYTDRSQHEIREPAWTTVGIAYEPSPSRSRQFVPDEDSQELLHHK
jgi:hypothetical protein